MKSYFLVLLGLVVLFSSCTSRMGDLTMISTRNIDKGAEYQELSRYVEGKDRVLTSILFIPIPQKPNFEEATDDAVRKVPGGEYLKNATVKSRWRWWILWSTEATILTGDVWGEDNGNGRVFKVGDIVKIKHKGEILEGEIIKIDGGKAVVKYMDSKGREKSNTKNLNDLME